MSQDYPAGGRPHSEERSCPRPALLPRLPRGAVRTRDNASCRDIRHRRYADARALWGGHTARRREPSPVGFVREQPGRPLDSDGPRCSPCQCSRHSHGPWLSDQNSRVKEVFVHGECCITDQINAQETPKQGSDNTWRKNTRWLIPERAVACQPHLPFARNILVFDDILNMEGSLVEIGPRSV